MSIPLIGPTTGRVGDRGRNCDQLDHFMTQMHRCRLGYGPEDRAPVTRPRIFYCRWNEQKLWRMLANLRTDPSKVRLRPLRDIYPLCILTVMRKYQLNQLYSGKTVQILEWNKTLNNQYPHWLCLWLLFVLKKISSRCLAFIFMFFNLCLVAYAHQGWIY